MGAVNHIEDSEMPAKWRQIQGKREKIGDVREK